MPVTAETEDPIIPALRLALAHLAGPDVGISLLPISPEHRALADEEQCIANAIESRRREFAAGRTCARAALAAVGCPSIPILRGSLHQPLWPPGYDGSISHTARVAAAVAYQSDLPKRLGVDLVDLADIDSIRTVAASFLTEEEITRSTHHPPLWIVKAFSAKEAAIKILSPIRRTFIDFLSVTVRNSPDGFCVQATDDDKLIPVRFHIGGGMLLTVAQRLG